MIERLIVLCRKECVCEYGFIGLVFENMGFVICMCFVCKYFGKIGFDCVFECVVN